MNDNSYMQMAIDLAKKGLGFTSPNPMVGAIVVKNEKVVGKGYHQVFGGNHAEVNAIDDAGIHAKDATLYVTLEPCNHTGKTPPCTEKIIRSGIKRTVIAMADPNPSVKGGGIDCLKKHNIAVTLGIEEKAAKRLNEFFIKYVKTKRPFVILKCAATLDGQIATRTGDSKWVTGEKSRQYVHRLRHATDAIMVGINTIRKDNPSLTTRLQDIKGKDPVRIILDTNLTISEKANVLQLHSDSDTIVFVGNSVSKTRINSKKFKKGRILSAELKNQMIDLESVMFQLGDMGITSLLIEGGARIISSALKEGIVDKVLFFYAPKILGGNDGVPICRGAGPALMKECIRVENINIRRFDDDIMFEGYVN